MLDLCQELISSLLHLGMRLRRHTVRKEALHIGRIKIPNERWGHICLKKTRSRISQEIDLTFQVREHLHDKHTIHDRNNFS